MQFLPSIIVASAWKRRTTCLAIVQALAGADPTGPQLAGPSNTSQRAFWRTAIAADCSGAEPRLNFVTQGGEAAVMARVLPQDQVRW